MDWRFNRIGNLDGALRLNKEIMTRLRCYLKIHLSTGKTIEVNETLEHEGTLTDESVFSTCSDWVYDNYNTSELKGSLISVKWRKLN